MKVRVYQTYRFINKDPIIDVLRTAMQDEAKRRGVTLKVMQQIIAEESGVTVTTFEGWFKGGTKRPFNATVLAVATAIGPEARRMVSNFILGLGEDKVIPFRQRKVANG
jgi:hypothetical protein